MTNRISHYTRLGRRPGDFVVLINKANPINVQVGKIKKVYRKGTPDEDYAIEVDLIYEGKYQGYFIASMYLWELV